MNDLTTETLFILLGVMILLSAFFSSSETALMTLNRYRAKSLADNGHRGAGMALELLKRPDRLLGLILLGNNVVNFFAATVATVLAIRLYGEIGLAVVPFVLTFVMLVFAEVTPKTLAALKPESLAFPAAYVYTLIALPSYPFVWMVNLFSNTLLRLVGIHTSKETAHQLSEEEVRAVVMEAEHFMPREHTDMLLSILDLEQISVEDIMIPRNEITGIDLNDDWNEIIHQITHSQRTRVPVFHDSIDNIAGVLHLRKVLNLFSRDELSMDSLKNLIVPAYFIPAGTPLTRQMLNFQDNRRRSGLVVDEYGSIQGLVTLEDILEEIVGQFTTDSPTRSAGIREAEDGSWLVDGNTHIRDINRTLGWSLPADGPKTLNGLILEHLEIIPPPGTSFMLDNYTIEITRTTKNAVQAAKLNDTTRVEEASSDDQIAEHRED